MSSPRRRFLSWLGSASLLGAASSPSLLRAGAPLHSGASDNDHAAPIAETWDMSWTERVTGKYKAVFDSPQLAFGAAVYRAIAWCEQYKEVYGATRAEMSPIVVLRHEGFYLAMNDAYWERFEIGKELKLRDGQNKKWAKVNPLGPAAVAADASMARNSLHAFTEAGGIALVCGWSFGGAAQRFVRADKLEREAARARAREHLLPGMILQPNGIFAALRAQEAGCSYIMAS
jgi:hypothetical protein